MFLNLDLKHFYLRNFFIDRTPFNFIVTYVNSVFKFFLDMGTLKTSLFIIIIIVLIFVTVLYSHLS